ncbi:hypothetical protein MTR67_031504 [Solanum verrucosum]|uniref:Reverse transcriptase/retrotransposon-derived protein RNase H-like domain-containing protein n=1 Tax=Solanum verrucosum TaxID=315347 RepID=A0AAF0ZHQ2_SOLVR|nr:hypothetical protein MTR67_031504 [Solanum verrucosum]
MGFIVYCDSLGVGLGGVLMQKGKLITSASRQLKTHEKKYRTHDLEFATSLHYLFNERDLNLRQCRWLELLNNYDMTILYNLGRTILK